MSALLSLREVSIDFITGSGLVRAVDRVDFDLNPADVLGIIGESGSGKSLLMLAVMGLLPPNAILSAEMLEFGGIDLRGLSRRGRRHIIGKDIAMIFQDPTASLNPCFTIGYQIAEVLRTHTRHNAASRRAQIAELLTLVGIKNPDVAKLYPHQLSGGMNQRAMIAMAIAAGPKLLIADEATTALDVTIQKEILDLLAVLQQRQQMAMILITHDLGIAETYAKHIAVLYAGQIVEIQPARSLFTAPHHPYTAALRDASPAAMPRGGQLPSIKGVVPSLSERPSGCQFHPRCDMVQEDCRADRPPLSQKQQAVWRCFHPLQVWESAQR